MTLTTEQLSTQEEAAEIFRKRLLAAGAAVIMPDGATVRPKTDRRRQRGRTPPKREALPAVIELGVVEPSSGHVVRFEHNGVVIELHPAAVTVGIIRLNGWFGQQIAKVYDQMGETDDPAEAQALSDRITPLQEAQLRCFFPDFPVGLLGELPPPLFGRLWDTINALVREASPPEDASPNDVAA